MDNKVNRRLCGMLGFAMRAGRLAVGVETVCKAMAKKGKDRVRLVLIAYDASCGTKKKLLTKAEFYGVTAIEIDIDQSELGRLIGKLYAPAAVAVTDDGFAEEIRRALSDIDTSGSTN